MYKSEFHISKMDCPSEENMIRMKLDGLLIIKKLDFDIENRNLTVFHSKVDEEILTRLESLNFGAKFTKVEKVDEATVKVENAAEQSKLLWTVLLINFAFFIIEITTGIISKSMGLVADSLDMLADALV